MPISNLLEQLPASCPNLQQLAFNFISISNTKQIPDILNNLAFTFPFLVEFSIIGIEYPEPFLQRHPNLRVLRCMELKSGPRIDSSLVLPKLGRFAGKASDFLSISGHGMQPIEHLVVSIEEDSIQHLLQYLSRTKTIRYLSVEPSWLNFSIYSTFAFTFDYIIAIITSSPSLTTFVCSLDLIASRTSVSLLACFFSDLW